MKIENFAKRCLVTASFITIFITMSLIATNAFATASTTSITFASIATDAQGNVFTVHGGNKPNHDIIMWSAATGRVVSTSGDIINGSAQAITVDGEYIYVTASENISDRKAAKMYIARVRLKKESNRMVWTREPFSRASNELVLYNGGAEYPQNASAADRKIMFMPLLSLAVKGKMLYIVDSLRNRVLACDKATGEVGGAFSMSLPQAIAIAPNGKIWVGHGHSKISVYDDTGKLLATPLTNLKEISAIAFDSSGKMYVADQGTGQVKIYAVNGNIAKQVRTLGQKAQPKDRAANRFFTLCGVTVNKQGNVITAQNTNNGGQLAKFSPAGKVLWQQSRLPTQLPKT